jgi:(2Fe-2S) ferredoxin
MALRDHYLFVCTNRRPEGSPKGSCAQDGAEQVLLALKSELAKAGWASHARACASGCLDQCGAGPAVLVEPDHFLYRHVSVEDVPAIVQALSDGRRVERLVIPSEEPDAKT